MTKASEGAAHAVLAHWTGEKKVAMYNAISNDELKGLRVEE